MTIYSGYPCIYCGCPDVEETAYDHERDVAHWLCCHCGLAFNDLSEECLSSGEEIEYCNCPSCSENLND